MAGTSLLALIDDIATVLDDVAILTKVAAGKTAGVLGDDLASCLARPVALKMPMARSRARSAVRLESNALTLLSACATLPCRVESFRGANLSCKEKPWQ